MAAKKKQKKKKKKNVFRAAGKGGRVRITFVGPGNKKGNKGKKNRKWGACTGTSFLTRIPALRSEKCLIGRFPANRDFPGGLFFC